MTSGERAAGVGSLDALPSQQPFELFVALNRERFEVETDTPFERPARNPVRENANERDRKQ